MTDTLLNGEGEQDQDIFDPAILDDLDFSQCLATYSPAISIRNPGENLKVRPLKRGDYDRGYMHLLTHLTIVGEVSKEQFEERFSQMMACANSYYIVVVEDISIGQIVGTATLSVEMKFIRQCASRARVEDVVVDDRYRGQQLGKLLLDILMLLCQKLGCYKISLECKDKMVPFYEKFGYSTKEQNYMVKRYQ